MSSTSAAAHRRTVSLASSGLGDGSPLGWLCRTMRRRRAGRETRRHEDVGNGHWRARARCRARAGARPGVDAAIDRQATPKFSTGSPARSGARIAAAMRGVDSARVGTSTTRPSLSRKGRYDADQLAHAVTACRAGEDTVLVRHVRTPFVGRREALRATRGWDGDVNVGWAAALARRGERGRADASGDGGRLASSCVARRERSRWRGDRARARAIDSPAPAPGRRRRRGVRRAARATGVASRRGPACCWRGRGARPPGSRVRQRCTSAHRCAQVLVTGGASSYSRTVAHGRHLR